MLIVDNVLVSEELIQQFFCCNLAECRGCCCIAGDIGAPLNPDEIADLEDNYPIFKKYMTEEGVRVVETHGTFDYDIDGEFVTPLRADEACAFLYHEDGIAKCAIEKAFLSGEITFQKPISCHLYPIRIRKLPDYDALNYHRWEICEAARALGTKEKIPVYKFLKEPLIRLYGEDWYKKLENQVQELQTK